LYGKSKNTGQAQAKFALVPLEFGSGLFVLGCAHDTTSPVLQLASAQCCLIGHGFGLSLGWFEDEEATLHTFPTNFEPKPDRTFCGVFCYCRITII
jgi:hypothetical protein